MVKDTTNKKNMRYIIKNENMNPIKESFLSFIRDSYSDDDDHFWQNSQDWSYEISEDVYNELKKFDNKEHPYIKGFESDSDYEDFFFENQQYIIEYLEEFHENIYGYYGIFKYNITGQQFYRGLYYTEDTSKTDNRVFSIISKFVISEIVSDILYRDFCVNNK